jgi:hypothetical protein
MVNYQDGMLLFNAFIVVYKKTVRKLFFGQFFFAQSTRNLGFRFCDFNPFISRPFKIPSVLAVVLK